MHCHPGPVLGGGRPRGGEAGAGHLDRDDSGGEGGEVGAGRSFQRCLDSPCWSWQFLAGEDELAGHLPVRLPRPRPRLSRLLAGGRLDLPGGGEADVPDTLELLALPHQAPGADLSLGPAGEAVTAEAGHQGVVRSLGSLDLDLDLFWFLGDVQTGVIFLLLSHPGGGLVLSALPGAVREVEVVRQVQTERSLSSPSSSRLSQNSAVWVEVRLAGRAPHRLPRGGEVGALSVVQVLTEVLLLLVPQSDRRGLLYHLQDVHISSVGRFYLHLVFK